jgi:hypothetical protein
MRPGQPQRTLPGMTNAPSARLCRIERELGNIEPCAERDCFFWQESTNGGGGGCIFDRVDFAARHDLAQFLHDLRHDAEDAARASDDELRHLFFERLNAGKSD